MSEYKGAKKWLITTAVVFLSIIIFIELFVLAVSVGLFGEMPSTEELKNPTTSLASEVYTADSVSLGKYYYQNRSHVSFDEISPHAIQALIAAEDERFYKHSGIDWPGVGRVIVKTIILGKEEEGGGSTITQQLAKNLFSKRKRGKFNLIVAKLKEWAMAARLEHEHSKDQILTMYFNTVSFSQNQFGLKSASNTFFNKSPDSLNVEEAALLIGTLKATTLYDPVRNPENSKQRRNEVLDRMVKNNMLSAAVSDSLKQLPVELDFKKPDPDEGLAAYFREHLRTELQEWLKKNPINGKTYNLYADGLKIYTTLNSTMQKLAEDAVREHMKRLQGQFESHWGRGAPWHNKKVIESAMKRSRRYKTMKEEGYTEKEIQEAFNTPRQMTVFSWSGKKEKEMTPMDSIKYYLRFLHAGFMAMEPQTGYVKAWVGGIGHEFFQYDHVNKKAKRQVGSTFKPFVYTVAVDRGWDPCHYVPNQPITFRAYKNWTPKNANGKYGGVYTLQGGLAHSVNTITAYFMKEVGPHAVVNYAKKMGIESKLEPLPSIALGSADVSVSEMVAAYTPFVNDGYATKPLYVLKIADKDDHVLYDFTPEKQKVLDTHTSEVMLHILQKVVTEGTASRLRYQYGLYNDMAGKTGTTQDHADGWFMGMVPNLVGGAWVGGEDRRIHFRTLSLGSGANMALPIWAKFMQKVYASGLVSKNDKFQTPTVSAGQLNCEPYMPDSLLVDSVWIDSLALEFDYLEGYFDDLLKKKKERDSILKAKEAEMEEEEKKDKDEEELEEEKKKEQKKEDKKKEQEEKKKEPEKDESEPEKKPAKETPPEPEPDEKDE